MWISWKCEFCVNCEKCEFCGKCDYCELCEMSEFCEKIMWKMWFFEKCGFVKIVNFVNKCTLKAGAILP